MTDRIRGDEDITEGLLHAFKLEKGAHAFYATAAERVREPGAAKTFRTLAAVEERHMRAVYDLYNGLLGERAPLPFEAFTEKMEAAFTESGRTLEAALADVEGRFFLDPRAVLETALEEERAAQALYLRMADRAGESGTATLYRELAADESHHMAMIEEALGRVAGRG